MFFADFNGIWRGFPKVFKVVLGPYKQFVPLSVFPMPPLDEASIKTLSDIINAGVSSKLVYGDYFPIYSFFSIT